MNIFGLPQPYTLDDLTPDVKRKVDRIASIVRRRWDAHHKSANAAQMMWLGYVHTHKSGLMPLVDLVNLHTGSQVWEPLSKIKKNILLEIDMDNPALFRVPEVGIDESTQEPFLVGGRHRILVFILICQAAGIPDDKILGIKIPVQRFIVHDISERTRIVRASNIARSMSSFEKQQLEVEARGGNITGRNAFATLLREYWNSKNLKFLYLLGAMAFEQFWNQESKKIIDFEGKEVTRITNKTIANIGKSFIANAYARLAEEGKEEDIFTDPDEVEELLYTGYELMFDIAPYYNYRIHNKIGLPSAAPNFGAKIAEEGIDRYYSKDKENIPFAN